MDPDEIGFQMELLSFNSKIALAELEAAKAQERVKELIYQREQYQFDFARTRLHKAESQAKADINP